MFYEYLVYRLRLLLYGVVALCDGANRKVPQLHTVNTNVVSVTHC